MPKWIYTQPILPKCHSPHFLSPTSFFSRSVAHPSKICKQKHLSKFQKQFKFPLQTQKESKQNNPPSADPQNAQKQNQKDTTIHFIQPPYRFATSVRTPCRHDGKRAFRFAYFERPGPHALPFREDRTGKFRPFPCRRRIYRPDGDTGSNRYVYQAARPIDD